MLDVDSARRQGLCLVCRSNRAPPETESGRGGICHWCLSKKHGHKYRVRRQKTNERTAREARKRRVLRAYGGCCECCKEANPAFLTIDHVHSDGKQHRAELRAAGTTIYRWLEDSGFPQDGRFRILCFNCNIARHHNGGACPHTSRPTDRA